jgi:hypothetical protein
MESKETQIKEKITTIKISMKTKKRIDNLKVYKRETYDDIVIKILNILNLTIQSPEKARERLLLIEREKKNH